MNDITVIIPILDKDVHDEKLTNAVNSVVKCQEHYTNGKLKIMIVVGVENEQSKGYEEKVFENVEVKYLANPGKTDFCSQINYAVDHVETDYFSILEFDDEYKPKWFKFVNEYQYGNEEVSIFLPVNVVTDTKSEHWQYLNEIALATSNSDEIGIIDMEMLNMWTGFNLTGGVFNTSDFIKVGKYKPSIKIAFNYELMMRMINKKLRIMVVPKEGYVHVIGRKDSLTDTYNKEIPPEEIKLWFDLAKREYTYDTDREKDITRPKKAKLS